MKALILAAGLGTRLGSLTADRPKCMMPVAGRPLLEHLLRWVRDHGISEIAINLHYRPEVIIDHCGTGESLGVDLTYSHEPELLGTAGAAKRLEGYFDGPFAVIYGDGYTNMDLGRLVRAHEARRENGTPHVTMTLFRVPNPSACGLAEMDADQRVTRFIEKPAPEEVFTDLASAGILILEPELLDFIPPNEPFDVGRDLLPAALAAGVPIYGEPLLSDELLIDIGTPTNYQRAEDHAEMA